MRKQATFQIADDQRGLDCSESITAEQDSIRSILTQSNLAKRGRIVSGNSAAKNAVVYSSKKVIGKLFDNCLESPFSGFKGFADMACRIVWSGTTTEFYAAILAAVA